MLGEVVSIAHGGGEPLVFDRGHFGGLALDSVLAGTRSRSKRRVASQVSFERDIRPLFRDDDAEAMSWAFDLVSYEDVKENAEAIYERLADGSMPCDEPWPETRKDAGPLWS